MDGCVWTGVWYNARISSLVFFGGRGAPPPMLPPLGRPSLLLVRPTPPLPLRERRGLSLPFGEDGAEELLWSFERGDFDRRGDLDREGGLGERLRVDLEGESLKTS